MRKAANVEDVKAYWETHPLHAYEFEADLSPEFFARIDTIKRADIERFGAPFWEFDSLRGKKLLEVGCGPGWFTVQYARGGVQVTSVDLTGRAVEITKAHLRLQGLEARVQEANAERLPFSENEFDVVISTGVLHHTPDTPRAIRECFRVLKPGGRAKIALYHRGILHSPIIFPIVRFLMSAVKVKHPGADMANKAGDVDDFVRQYDGEGNPVGIAKTTAEWSRILREAGFKIEGSELHYFPKRFIPFGKFIPDFVHFFLDRVFGTMIYFNLRKPSYV